MKKKLSIAFSAACALGIAASVQAAPTIIQNYETPFSLEDPAYPFSYPPHYSGTTENIDITTDSITQITDDGAAGTSSSAELNIPYTTGTPVTLDTGEAWQVRFLPNNGGHGATAFDPTGNVGYYLKVDPAAGPKLLTAPLLEEASGGTGTATGGVLKPIINDGQWHLYSWDMSDSSQFPNTFNQLSNGIYGRVATGGLGDTTLTGQQVFDSIAILSSDPINATVRIDEIGVGFEVPEPASLGLLGIGGLALLRRRRRLPN